LYWYVSNNAINSVDPLGLGILGNLSFSSLFSAAVKAQQEFLKECVQDTCLEQCCTCCSLHGAAGIIAIDGAYWEAVAGLQAAIIAAAETTILDVIGGAAFFAAISYAYQQTYAAFVQNIQDCKSSCSGKPSVSGNTQCGS
jgi:hypothetical protein